MKKLIPISLLFLLIMACGPKTEQKAELTPAQELQSVDSATQETKAQINEMGKSVEALQKEVDSLLNEKK